MPPFRPRPHRPVVGSVQPQDAPRLQRLRDRLSRRWQRRRRRELIFLAVAVAALGLSVALVVGFGVSPLRGTTLRAIEVAAIVVLVGGALAGAVYALWRYDRTHRRARSAHIRLHHVERRLESLRGAAVDGDVGVVAEPPVGLQNVRTSSPLRRIR